MYGILNFSDSQESVDGMSQILFFALREDLLPVLELVESKEPVKYVLTGNFPERKVARGVPTFDRGAAIPNLGKADHENGSETYFVHERDARLRFRRLRGVGGNRVIVGDQSREPDTVSFTPGGLWKNNIVLRGTISTISDSPISRRLMRRFQAATVPSSVEMRNELAALNMPLVRRNS